MLIVSKRKPATPKLLHTADIPLNRNFSQEDYLLYQLQVCYRCHPKLSKLSRKYRRHVPPSPNKCRYNKNIFKDKCNWQPSTPPPPHPQTKYMYYISILYYLENLLRFWSFTWLKNSRSKVCGNTCNYISIVVNIIGSEEKVAVTLRFDQYTVYWRHWSMNGHKHFPFPCFSNFTNKKLPCLYASDISIS